jgi:hypothetical protein
VTGESTLAIVQASVLSNSDWLLFLQKPSDDARAIEPIYFARTFEDALKYLPLCEAFQDAFALDDTGRWVNKKPLYYVVDNDGEIYYTRCVCSQYLF